MSRAPRNRTRDIHDATGFRGGVARRAPDRQAPAASPSCVAGGAVPAAPRRARLLSVLVGEHMCASSKGEAVPGSQVLSRPGLPGGARVGVVAHIPSPARLPSPFSSYSARQLAPHVVDRRHHHDDHGEVLRLQELGARSPAARDPNLHACRGVPESGSARLSACDPTRALAAALLCPLRLPVHLLLPPRRAVRESRHLLGSGSGLRSDRKRGDRVLAG